ncbi:DUF5694 domain-containing protein [Aureibacter tunicatorum]|uniref:TraB/GumN family protein n=1 Tax=Aureibacter tunicatorum TaxID=866807 RepID=A0AAE4BQT8_9BACT|nr:DUF5694 domain-containing protein [Aureibacter tunicatorum]MDR6239529.1 hypothetical protein [Aureibacter tunicatorum]BDD04006.1 hypothetical protein AUTU_14890 [Aureibacter tunicatorum]
MKQSLLIIALILSIFTTQAQDNKIKVLNLGVFHLSYTPDAHSTKFDEKSNMSQIQEVNELIAKFKPTIIVVEKSPKYQADLEKSYQAYLNDPEGEKAKYTNETGLMAFEIGRLAGTKRIYAIDHKMGYQYYQDRLAKKLNSDNYFETVNIVDSLRKIEKRNPEIVGFKNVISYMNTQGYRDQSFNSNVDYLFYANSKNKFEGVDQASKFYHRNLRMFANICKIEANENDRILIISGAAHASFFHDFLSRSYIYEVEPVEKYLHPNDNL